MSSRNKRTRRCESEIRTMSRLEPTSTAFIFIFFCVGFRCFADAWNYEKFMARFFCSANRALSQWFSCIVEFEILTVVCVCVSVCDIESQMSIWKEFDKSSNNNENDWKADIQMKRKWAKTRATRKYRYVQGSFWCLLVCIPIHRQHKITRITQHRKKNWNIYFGGQMKSRLV